MKIAERKKVWITIFSPAGGYISERLWSEKTKTGCIFYDDKGHKRVLIEPADSPLFGEKGKII